jgi:hypothetical protein
MKAFNSLIPVPIPRMASGMMNGEGIKYIFDTNTAMIVSIVYIGLLLFGTYYLLKNRDL